MSKASPFNTEPEISLYEPKSTVQPPSSIKDYVNTPEVFSSVSQRTQVYEAVKDIGPMGSEEKRKDSYYREDSARDSRASTEITESSRRPTNVTNYRESRWSVWDTPRTSAAIQNTSQSSNTYLNGYTSSPASYSYKDKEWLNKTDYKDQYNTINDSSKNSIQGEDLPSTNGVTTLMTQVPSKDIEDKNNNSFIASSEATPQYTDDWKNNNDSSGLVLYTYSKDNSGLQGLNYDSSSWKDYTFSDEKNHGASSQREGGLKDFKIKEAESHVETPLRSFLLKDEVQSSYIKANVGKIVIILI